MIFFLSHTGLSFLLSLGRRMNLVTFNSSSASMTGGLVQEFEHSVLPTVKPIHTFLLTIAQMLVRVYAIHIDIGLTYQYGLVYM